MLPGAMAPKVSCVILLNGPVGVTSVSPTVRAATTTSRNVASTASSPIHQWMWKIRLPSTIAPRPKNTKPATNHEPGTSMRSIGSAAAPGERPRNEVMVPNARSTDFHCMKNSSSPEVTIMGTPIHRLHAEILRNEAASITPELSIIGASSR